MKVARFRVGPDIAYGVIEGEQVRRMEGSPFGEFRPTGQAYPLREVHLLAPVVPRKVLAMGWNYRSHLHGRPAPTRPELFYKAPSCIIGPEEPILLPPDAGRVDAEGELVVVIGRECKGVSPREALDYVLGYTCGNDVSAREWQLGQDKDLQWWRAKGTDTFGPVGPYIVTDWDPARFVLRTRHNGQEVQHGDGSDLLFDVPTIISFVSRYVTLEPGDLIFTGTPGTTPALSPGDVVEVEIEGIGVLRNLVQMGRAPQEPSP